jgi:hypothetical protein
MRLFHFVNEKFGLQDIRRRRIKVATLLELNDPFELLGADLSNAALRNAVIEAKEEYAKISGFICFSQDWRNPVQWSHYADRHRGLCLAFDLPDNSDLIRPITYAAKRFAVDVEHLARMTTPDQDLFSKFLFTKFSHWRYEKEFRAIKRLAECEVECEKGLYFTKFSSDLKLATVIVGERSTITRATLCNALGDLASSVKTFKARLAFKTFRVVRQRNERLWL